MIIFLKMFMCLLVTTLSLYWLHLYPREHQLLLSELLLQL